MGKYNIDNMISLRKKRWRNTKSIEEDVKLRLSFAEYILRKDNQKLWKDLYYNEDKLIELFFVVVNKKKKTVPFFLNYVQRKFISKIKNDRKLKRAGRKKHQRYLILKGRQQGFTTIISAFQLACAIVHKNFDGYTLADDASNTEDIFQDKVKHVYELLPEKIAPSSIYNSSRVLHFDTNDNRKKGLNSKIRVQTAGNEDAGRSKTINFLHISEGAFVPKLKKLLTGLTESLTKDVIAIIESTANGYNDYKELWDSSNNWETLFYEWWKTPEYRMEFSDEKEKEEFLNGLNWAENEAKKGNNKEYEADTKQWIYSRCWWLYDEIELDMEQIYFYFDKWVDKKEKVKQEYPCTAEEAFLASGGNYFNIENVVRRKRKIENKAPSRRGDFEYIYTFDEDRQTKKIDDTSIKFVESLKGSVTIYNEPKEAKGYAIGGDTASEGKDFNFAQVIDKQGNQHATIKIDKDEDLYADQTYCLGKLYNGAIIAFETNHSTHPIKVLREREYPRIYIRGQSTDQISRKKRNKFGYYTTKKNRNEMLGQLKTLVREHPERINDVYTLKQMMTFVRDENNKPVAEEGKHDDAILAYAIALAIRDNTPRIKGKSEKKSKVQSHKENLVKQRRLKRKRDRRLR
ncbi:MAG: hypothetical protein ACQEQF_00625 [Bacillota bacterium]